MVRYGVNVQSALLSCYMGHLSLTLILSHWALSDNLKLENGQLTFSYYMKSAVTEKKKIRLLTTSPVLLSQHNSCYIIKQLVTTALVTVLSSAGVWEVLCAML
jgi:hypothetical protein